MLDDIIPVREKYRPPSPLPERQPSLSPRRTPEKMVVERPLKNQWCPADFSIDITYSPDTQMIHRFVNCEVSSKDHERVFAALQAYIGQVELDDQGAFMYHQMQEQYEERLTTGAIAGSREFQPKSGSKDEYEKQITIAMIMDPSSVLPSSGLARALSSARRRGTETESKYRTITKQEIERHASKGHAYEKHLAKWIVTFFAKMHYEAGDRKGLLAQEPRFSEIRPMPFY